MGVQILNLLEFKQTIKCESQLITVYLLKGYNGQPHAIKTFAMVRSCFINEMKTWCLTKLLLELRSLNVDEIITPI